jgi:cytochrome c oxidase assembly protein subunit 15
LGTWLVALAFVQIVIGALVAGIDAGRNYTDWPLMAGGFLPPEPFGLTPIWRNFFEDDGLVQFMHRMAGYILFAFGIFIWLHARASGNTRTKFAFNLMLAVMTLQVVLGITTVIYSAPWHIAIVHQLGAVVLWVVILRARFLAAYPHPQTIQGA